MGAFFAQKAPLTLYTAAVRRGKGGPAYNFRCTIDI